MLSDTKPGAKSKPANTGEAPKKERLSEEEEMDREVASAALFEGLLSDNGIQALNKAFKTPEPAKAVAMLIFNVIEPAQVASMDSETPLSPRVWLAGGGAVDELLDEVADNADLFGVEEDQIEEMYSPIKQEVTSLLQQRGEALQQEGMQASQAPPQQAPVPMPGGGSPMMGGA